MTRKKFIRRDWKKYKKLGQNRRKKQKWRKPKGKHNKMREKRTGYPRKVCIGYRDKEEKALARVSNMHELHNLKEKKVILAAGIGKKKKIEILKKCKEMGIELVNINVKKFTKKVEEAKDEKSKDKKTEEKIEVKDAKKEEHKENKK